jgi:hypothetical protein
MMLDKISNGNATFYIPAEECALLARALGEADPASLKPEEYAAFTTMTAAFKAAAIAGLAQTQMLEPALAHLDKVMAECGLVE